MRVAREFRGLSEVGASMQSLDSNVLEAIKRRNLDIQDVADMIQALNDEESNDLLLGTDTGPAQ